ncbi:hypothetical protein NQ317_003816 [Molorchus minor]|uniref:endo-polygalacturonase n=1 Tax=Molorchus minor TaxID=1323400 RepID=A0ABQ9JC86_9CUCU|nr:hypothetical protein NQ317_003816 [Molorchus minor]
MTVGNVRAGKYYKIVRKLYGSEVTGLQRVLRSELHGEFRVALRTVRGGRIFFRIQWGCANAGEVICYSVEPASTDVCTELFEGDCPRKIHPTHPSHDPKTFAWIKLIPAKCISNLDHRLGISCNDEMRTKRRHPFQRPHQPQPISFEESVWLDIGSSWYPISVHGFTSVLSRAIARLLASRLWPPLMVVKSRQSNAIFKLVHQLTEKMVVATKYIVHLLAVILAASATPLNETSPRASCTVTSFNQVAAAVASCTNIIINGISVPAGRTLDLNLKEGARLTFQGRITFGHKEWDGPLIQVRGTRVTVEGATGHRIDGQGELYWDGLGGAGTKKPVLFSILANGGSVFSRISLLNCPERCTAISANDVTLNLWNIDCSLGDTKGGHNTDGFDVVGNNIVVKNSIVRNQDDCVAINYGTNMRFSNLQCSGSHGLSLAVGMSKTDYKYNVVKNVTFSDCIVTNSVTAIHVKTVADGGKGAISDVTYKNIKFSGRWFRITWAAINVQEDYRSQGSSGKPVGNVPITNLRMIDIKGTVAGPNSLPVYILCGVGGCKNWSWSGISISGGQHPSSCNFKPAGFASNSVSPTNYSQPRDSCTVNSYDQVANALQTCSDIVIDGITVPAGQTLELDLLEGAKLTFQGRISFEHAEWDGPLIQVQGRGVTVQGAPGHVLDGQGALYWDGLGGAGTKKPVFISVVTSGGSLFTNLYLLNCPERCAALASDDLTVDNWIIDVSDGDTQGGHNTDGFDVVGNNVLVKNSVVKNQDDCVAINRGSNMYFSNLTCSGTHGLSLAIGMSQDYDYNTLTNVTFTDCYVYDSLIAIHVKTISDGGQGIIRDVTYRNIMFSGMTRYGINVQEDYANQGSTGVPVGNVPITNLQMINVQGTVTGQDAMPVYILCGDGGCIDWTWTDVSISGENNLARHYLTSTDCKYFYLCAIPTTTISNRPKAMLTITQISYILSSLLAVLAADTENIQPRASCTVNSFEQVADAVETCTDIVIDGITVPGGQAIELGLQEGSRVTFQGRITFEHAEWDGPLIQVQGTGVTVQGAPGHVLDGQGALYWDGLGGSGTKKPVFIGINTVNSFLTDLYLLNCPHRCAALASDGLTIDNWIIDVSDGDELGVNTDGFDVVGNGVVVKNSVVKNQDDCVAINRGSNMYFSNLTCSGTHGLSIAIGQGQDYEYNTLTNVTFTDCYVYDSANAIHVKTVADGGPGAITDITYKNIRFSGINRYGINVQQDYVGGSGTGVPVGNVPITNLQMINIEGTVTGENAMPVYIICADGACSDWTWSGISVEGVYTKGQRWRHLYQQHQLTIRYMETFQKEASEPKDCFLYADDTQELLKEDLTLGRKP